MDDRGEGAQGWAVPDSRPADTGGPPASSTPPPPSEVAGGGVGGGGSTERPEVPVPLRPLTVGDILDGSFQLIKLHPRAIIGFTALLTVPMAVVSAWIQRDQLGGVFEINSDATLGDALAGTETGAGILATYLLLLPLPFIGAFIAQVAAAGYAGRTLTFGEGARHVLSLTPALLGGFVISHLILAVGFIGFFIGTYFLMPLTLTLAPAISVERLGGLAGIRRSWRLGSRRYGPLLGLIAAAAGVELVLDTAFQTLPALIADGMGPDLGWIVLGVGSAAGMLLSVPFTTGVAVLAYMDIRIRTEGLDLELRSDEAFADGSGR